MSQCTPSTTTTKYIQIKEIKKLKLVETEYEHRKPDFRVHGLHSSAIHMS
jgi:hypothetical protein